MKTNQRTTAKTTGKPSPAIKKPAKVLISLALITLLSVLINIYFAIAHVSSTGRKNEIIPESRINSINILRTHPAGQNLIQPLALAIPARESDVFSTLKSTLSEQIAGYSQTGEVGSVSLFLMDLNTNSWMGIGQDAGFYPGSLMKVSILLYYLRQEENHPGTLSQKVVYEKPQTSFPSQAYKGDSIVHGRKYSLAELIRYMIIASDNNATYVLGKRIDQDAYNAMFRELDIPVYEVRDTRYQISPYDYSKFFRVLYNASFVNKTLSEYGLKLLTECSFNEGLTRALPPGTVVAHKFGERGFNYDIDFGESAIVYKDRQPYLLVIMTRGTAIGKQTELVRTLSKDIYHWFTL